MKSIKVNKSLNGILFFLTITSITTISYGQPKIDIQLAGEGKDNLQFTVTDASIVTHDQHEMLMQSQQYANKIFKIENPTIRQTRGITISPPPCTECQTKAIAPVAEEGHIDIEFFENNNPVGQKQKIHLEPGKSQTLNIGNYQLVTEITKTGIGEHSVYKIKMQ